MGPYDRCSIAAAVRLPKGRTRLLPFSPLISIPISQELGSPSEPHPSRPPTPTRMGRHPKPPTETHAPLEGKSIPAKSPSPLPDTLSREQVAYQTSIKSSPPKSGAHG